MKKIFSILFVLLFVFQICSGQNKNIQSEDFKKLEIFDGLFQHSYDLIFRSYTYGSCIGCWMQPLFEEIIFDTVSSKLKLTGKIICENRDNKEILPSNFIFIAGNIKIDTIKKNNRNNIELALFPNDIFRFYRTAKFELTLKILSSDDILCFTTAEEAEFKINETNHFFPVDFAHFYKIGNLLK